MKTQAKIVLGIAAIVPLFLAAKYLAMVGLTKKCLDWIPRLGPWGPSAFVAIYVLACVLFIPGSLLTLGAGVLFGTIRGTVYVSAASTLGAVCAFLIGRYLARGWVAELLKSHPRFQAVDEAVGKEGWRIVALARLSPLFPFNLLNYAFGLTGVSLKEYALASWIGMMPGTLMYVYIGSLAGDLAGLSSKRSRTQAEWALYFIGLAATVAVTVSITRAAKKSLEEKIRR